MRVLQIRQVLFPRHDGREVPGLQQALDLGFEEARGQEGCIVIKFTIPGDPVGYLRLTQGQLKLLHIPDHKLRPAGLRKKSEILRCFAYKNDVVKYSTGKGIDRKPKRKIHMKTMIYFRSGIRPDAENVHKLISDSLFLNDKNLSGTFDFDYDARNPRVEVEIYD